MKCQVCRSEMTNKETDLPFKVSDTSIVIIKGVPVVGCEACGEYLLEDPVMQRVEEILNCTDPAVELEIVRHAA